MVKLRPSRAAGQHFTPFERGILSAAIAIVAFGAIRYGMVGFLEAKRAEIQSAKEAMLREDCHVVGSAIDSYAVDLHQAPKSLADVIQAGYLKALPKDFSLERCK